MADPCRKSVYVCEVMMFGTGFFCRYQAKHQLLWERFPKSKSSGLFLHNFVERW